MAIQPQAHSALVENFIRKSSRPKSVSLEKDLIHFKKDNITGVELLIFKIIKNFYDLLISLKVQRILLKKALNIHIGFGNDAKAFWVFDDVLETKYIDTHIRFENF